MGNDRSEGREELLRLLYELPSGSGGSRAWIERLAARVRTAPALLHEGALELRDGLQAALEYLPMACLLLAGDRRVLAMNARARELIDAHPSLVLNQKQFEIVPPEVAGRLKQAIRECLDGGKAADGRAPKSFITLPRPNRLPIILWAAPFVNVCMPCLAMGSELVALFFYDPEYKIPLSEHYLREAYAMTRAEARVAVLLATGHGSGEIAKITGTTVNAVKFHLKAIYAKTGTHRQSELVARILPSAVLGCYEFR
jgi:DNA-binding CsgD family transcriptional regulator